MTEENQPGSVRIHIDDGPQGDGHSGQQQSHVSPGRSSGGQDITTSMLKILDPEAAEHTAHEAGE